MMPNQAIPFLFNLNFHHQSLIPHPLQHLIRPSKKTFTPHYSFTTPLKTQKYSTAEVHPPQNLPLDSSTTLWH
ncbi:hypothetical protein E2C01_044858 [Portunus trituberculatus]|uniref:Uncharacterized protein n=1 Tax=Portunus trituberculatus TaxID=210409 RepID=A0A5B7FU61_PORTR|nr:hypothetical protein [Portunus trituberculatus]